MKHAVLVGAVVLMAWTASSEESIRPGYWESVNRVVSPIRSEKTDRRCITAKDVAKFLKGPSNHIYACDYPEQSTADGKLSFRGECVDKKGHRVQVSGHGEYTATTFQLTADITFKLAGLPISAQATTDAHRIGDVCPAEAAK